MFDAGLTLESLRDCLADLPPVELKGMTLLRECRPTGQFFPQLTSRPNGGISREVIAEAVSEMVAYTQRCRQTAGQLARLIPIPLTTFSILEYGL